MPAASACRACVARRPVAVTGSAPVLAAPEARRRYPAAGAAARPAPPQNPCNNPVTHQGTKQWITGAFIVNNSLKTAHQPVLTTVYREEISGRKRPCNPP